MSLRIHIRRRNDDDDDEDDDEKQNAKLHDKYNLQKEKSNRKIK